MIFTIAYDIFFKEHENTSKYIILKYKQLKKDVNKIFTLPKNRKNFCNPNSPLYFHTDTAYS